MEIIYGADERQRNVIHSTTACLAYVHIQIVVQAIILDSSNDIKSIMAFGCLWKVFCLCVFSPMSYSTQIHFLLFSHHQFVVVGF